MGIPSFSVRDIGKAGVPALGKNDSTLLRAVLRYVPNDKLRFAFPSGRFILYYTYFDPCGQAYLTLNGNCTEGYQPDEDANKTMAFPGPCDSGPRPWITGDTNSGPYSWQDVYLGPKPKKQPRPY